MGRLWSTEKDAERGRWLEPRGAACSQAKNTDVGVHDTPMPGPLGEQLKGLFDHFSDGPMPDRLLNLADALEEAFQRGDLHKK